MLITSCNRYWTIKKSNKGKWIQSSCFEKENQIPVNPKTASARIQEWGMSALPCPITVAKAEGLRLGLHMETYLQMERGAVELGLISSWAVAWHVCNSGFNSQDHKRPYKIPKEVSSWTWRWIMCILIKILYPRVLDLLQVVGVINNCQSFVSYSNFSF